MKVMSEIQDDKYLIDAVKSLFNSYTPSPPTLIFKERETIFTEADWQRLLELAEIGAKSLEQARMNVIDKKREEKQDEEPHPHFAIAEICIDPCDICLCRKCITHCLDCPLNTEDCTKCMKMCAESCVKGTVCEGQEYVNYCPAYNDGHGF